MVLKAKLEFERRKEDRLSGDKDASFCMYVCLYLGTSARAGVIAF